jgi:hypothetical protein
MDHPFTLRPFTLVSDSDSISRDASEALKVLLQDAERGEIIGLAFVASTGDASQLNGTINIGLSWIPVCWIPGQARNDGIHSIFWPDQQLPRP